jgi:hypothetical protein
VQSFIRRFMQVGVLIFMTIAPAHAAGFSKASLKGSYSFMTNLWTANVSTNQFAMVGVMTFDGAGSVTASYTSLTGGVPQTGALRGTYSVKSNGTGTITFTTGSTLPHFAITLNSSAAGVAHSVQLLQTNDRNNEVISGTALLQSTTPETYTVASLKGNFGFQFNMWIADVNVPQYGGIGIASFDGKGNVKISGTVMDGGGLTKNTSTGTYAVNPDGGGSVSLSDNSQIALALNSVTAGQAKGAQLLVTKPSSHNGNYVIAGTALKH